MTAPARRPSRDGGQMMASLVVALAVTLLAFLVVAVVPVGAATDEKTRSQTAADAAALAGAEAIRTRWVDVDTAPAGLFYGDDPGTGRGLGVALGVRGGTGREAASSYAQANGATLTRYAAVPGRGQVEAEVRNRDTAYEETGRAESEATAEMDIDFRGCRWSTRPPGPTIESTPPGPPTFFATLSCGRWSARYEVENSTVLQFKVRGYGPGTARERLYRDLEPRLVR